jgi:hypothetical protein
MKPTFFVFDKEFVKTETIEQRGENSDIFYLDRTVRADVLGRIFLGSQKTS